MFGAEQRSCLDTLEVEHDNLRAAIGFAIEQGRAELAMGLLAASWRFWQMRGYLSEGRERADRILAMPDASAHPAMRLRALDAAGGIVYWQGDMATAREIYREQGRVATELDDAGAQAEAMYNEAMTYALESDATDAERIALEAREAFRALGDRAGEGKAQWAYLNALAYRSDVAAGEQIADDTVAIFREVNDRFMLAWALYTQALVRIQARDLEGARAALTESHEIFRDTNDVSGYALVLDGFASIEWLAGHRDRAMRIAGAASAIQDVSGVGLAARNREYAQFFPADLLKEAPLADAYAEGQKLSLEEAIRLALADGDDDPA
jgi:hypothetical protein